jgi:hypothetical protein
MTTSSISAAAYVPEISEIEGKFFTDIESILSSMTKPTGRGANEKPAVLTDEAAARYADELGDVLKAKFFNSNDLVLLKKSFENEKNSAVFDFGTVLRRAEQFGRDFDPAAVAAPAVTAQNTGAEASNIEVVVNLTGGSSNGSTAASSTAARPALSPLANDVYGALQSLPNRAAALQRGIETGDINTYSIGTTGNPGVYAKLMADAVAGRGIVPDGNITRTDILRASVEALNRMVTESLAEAQDA